MRYLVVYDRSIRIAISRRLREKKEWDISSFTTEVQEMRHLAITRQQEMRYFAVYERNKRNSISRRLRREQEMWYLTVYEGARHAISRRLREKNEWDISSFTREVQEKRHLAVTREEEMRYFAVCDRSSRNSISRRLREQYEEQPQPDRMKRQWPS